MFEKVAAPILTAIFLVTMLGSLTGCNTVEGLGKDIQQGGSVIKKEAQEIKKKL